LKKSTRTILSIAAALVVLFNLGAYGGALFMVSSMFTHRVERFRYTPQDLDLSGELVRFTSADNIPLAAWYIPHPAPDAVVILLHGMDGTDASSFLPHAKFLHEAGYAALSLDMRAHGYSGGERIGLAFEEPLDAAAAIDWVQSQPELAGKPIVLFGISMGGAVAIRTAADRPEVAAVISSCTYASIDRMIAQGMRLMGSPEWMISVFGPYSQLAMRTIYGVWPAQASPLHDIPAVSPRPILIMHGDADSQIPVENAYHLAEAGGENVELWIVPGADHFIFTVNGLAPEDTEYREKVLDFLGRVIK